jgi:hypothetical protein
MMTGQIRSEHRIPISLFLSMDLLKVHPTSHIRLTPRRDPVALAPKVVGLFDG